MHLLAVVRAEWSAKHGNGTVIQQRTSTSEPGIDNAMVAEVVEHVRKLFEEQMRRRSTSAIGGGLDGKSGGAGAEKTSRDDEGGNSGSKGTDVASTTRTCTAGGISQGVGLALCDMDVDSMYQRNADKLRQLQALTVDDNGLTRAPDTDELDALLSRFLNPQKGGGGGGGGAGGGGEGEEEESIRKEMQYDPLLSNRSLGEAAQHVGDWLAPEGGGFVPSQEPSLRSHDQLLRGQFRDDDDWVKMGEGGEATAERPFD